MESKYSKHIAFFGLLLVGIVLGILLLWPFLSIIILAAALAVVFYPIHRWFMKRVTRGNKWFAALLTIVTFIIIVGVPLFFIGIAVFHQSQAIYTYIMQGSHTNVLIDRINTAMSHYFPWADFHIQDKVASIAGAVTTRLGNIASYVVGTIFSFFLMILTMFYFLKDGPRWHRAIIHGSPLSDESSEKIVNKLELAVEGVVKGYLLIALVQGALLGIGLWIFRIPNPALWGTLAGIASLIPTVGTGFVSVPAVIFLFATGNTGAAIGLAVWSATMVGMIDNLLSPIVVGRKVDIHPMFILFAVLGGISLMGPAGILIGPLVVSFMYALTSVYASEMKS